MDRLTNQWKNNKNNRLPAHELKININNPGGTQFLNGAPELQSRKIWQQTPTC